MDYIPWIVLQVKKGGTEHAREETSTIVFCRPSVYHISSVLHAFWVDLLCRVGLQHKSKLALLLTLKKQVETRQRRSLAWHGLLRQLSWCSREITPFLTFVNLAIEGSLPVFQSRSQTTIRFEIDSFIYVIWASCDPDYVHPAFLSEPFCYLSSICVDEWCLIFL